ncbi:4-carboxymuconolactone decarboxylase [Acidocella aquatica]|uniref:4-carboxymuconolactone decarboxylase n=1 Tax=Acidocella aquatica TaxID=1922313 RepID=A0ABQ6ADY0_9PROT|nr:carboxymuconolactone decarboxylase family protein [Acidocella aquatica]GLR68418.1 4-carboxymuconolactone decarboxylase [Acidocella aquatica]
MTDRRQAGLDVVAKMLSPEVAKALDGAARSPEFGAFIGELALRNVFSELWTRPGLDLRSRSLVTLSILIALRASDELEVHLLVALRNGLSLSEIEEVIYHASGYAGFPAASVARTTALTVFRKHKLVES